MREAHPVERAVGIDCYVSDAEGTGGRIRERDADFRVRELERFDVQPADADPGAYNHVVLRATLHGWDTNDFVARLSDAMGISRERVSWAGTKDKHAVTTQLFSVQGIEPGDVPEVADAEVEVLGRAGRSLRFGDLAGNAFEVRVTDPERPAQAEAVAAELRAFAPGEGAAVPNFFGQQRFGSRRPVTHEVGLHVVRGEWREAVTAYVGNPFESEPAETRAARETVEEAVAGEDPDWAAALEALPHRLGFERTLCHALVENGADEPADYRDALEHLPSNLQRLFVHAAQSYAFNRVLSERLAEGLPLGTPVAGDVVCFADRDAPEGLALPDVDRSQRVTEDRVESVTRHCERDRAFVTVPLVGTETELGEGRPGEIERRVLDDIGLAPADFDLPGEFGSTGTRRAAVVSTDLTVSQGPLSFSFALPKGSYATVLLREFLKTDPLAMG